MGRLIDADELKEHLFVGADYDKAINDGIAKTEEEVFAFKCGWNDSLKSVAQFAPTVDPVKHGKWINDRGIYKCTACNDLCLVAGWAHCIPEKQMYKVFKFCPNCGAKMEVEDDKG